MNKNYFGNNVSQLMETINLKHHQVNFEEDQPESRVSLNAFSNLVSFDEDLVELNNDSNSPIISHAIDEIDSLTTNGESNNSDSIKKSSASILLNNSLLTTNEESIQNSSFIRHLSFDGISKATTDDSNISKSSTSSTPQTEREHQLILKRKIINLPSGRDFESLDEPSHYYYRNPANVHNYALNKIKEKKLPEKKFMSLIKNSESPNNTIEEIKAKSREVCQSNNEICDMNPDNIPVKNDSTSTVSIFDDTKFFKEKLDEKSEIIFQLEYVIQTQSNEIQNQRICITKLQNDLVDSSTELQSKLENLRDKLVEKDSTVEGLKIKLASTYVEKENMKQSFLASEMEIKSLRVEIETLIKSKTLLQKQCDNKQENLTELQKKLIALQTESVKSVNSMERMKTDKERVDHTLELVQQQALREKQQLAVHLETIEADMVEKEFELNQAKLSVTQALKSSNDNLQQQLHNYENSVTLITEKLENELVEKNELIERLSVSEASIVERDQQILKLNNILLENENMEERYSAEKEKCNELQQNVIHLEAALSKVQADLVIVHDQMSSSVKGKFSPLSSKIAALKLTNDSKENIISLIVEHFKEFTKIRNQIDDSLIIDDAIQLAVNENLKQWKVTDKKQKYEAIKHKAKRKILEKELNGKFDDKNKELSEQIIQLTKECEKLSLDRNLIQAKLEHELAHITSLTSKITDLENKEQISMTKISEYERKSEIEKISSSNNIESLLEEKCNLKLKLEEQLENYNLLLSEKETLTTQLGENGVWKTKLKDLENIYELRMKEWHADCTNRELNLKIAIEKLEHRNSVLEDKVIDFEKLQELVAELQTNYRKQSQLRSDAEQYLERKEMCDEGVQCKVDFSNDEFVVDLLQKLNSFKEMLKIKNTFVNGDVDIDDNVSTKISLNDLSISAIKASDYNPNLMPLIKIYQQILEILSVNFINSAPEIVSYDSLHENCLGKSEKVKLDCKIKDLQHELECCNTKLATNSQMLSELRESELSCKKECGEYELLVRNLKNENRRTSAELESILIQLSISKQQFDDLQILANSKETQIIANQEQIKCMEERFSMTNEALNSKIAQYHADLELIQKELKDNKLLCCQLKEKLHKIKEVLKRKDDYCNLVTFLENLFDNTETENVASKSSSTLLHSCLLGLRSQITTLQSQVTGHLLKVQSSTQAWKDLEFEVDELKAICKE